jgi:hypothetical protein
MRVVAHIHSVPMVCFILGASDFEDGIPQAAIDRQRVNCEQRSAWLSGWHKARREALVECSAYA